MVSAEGLRTALKQVVALLTILLAVLDVFQRIAQNGDE